MNSIEIGKKLRELRGDKSQECVARAIGVSTSALIKYENGERIPRDEIKLQIARYYNSSVEDIFFAH